MREPDATLLRLRATAESALANGWDVNIDPPQPDEIIAALDHVEAVLADAYQAVASLLDHCGLSDHPDSIRLLDVLAYGRTEDGIELLPFPKNPLPSPHDALMAERDQERALAAKLMASLRATLRIARRNEGSPELGEAARLLDKVGGGA